MSRKVYINNIALVFDINPAIAASIRLSEVSMNVVSSLNVSDFEDFCVEGYLLCGCKLFVKASAILHIDEGRSVNFTLRKACYKINDYTVATPKIEGYDVEDSKIVLTY